ncbi:nucleotide-binding domain containing protein [Streptomyces sp. NPDC050264]|uniref:nucleotide-binding domain containing protein n=1 Tax=Streptomyces sp. NPDC050264 TaxID=3155038 RepID=UPI00343F2DD2
MTARQLPYPCDRFTHPWSSSAARTRPPVVSSPCCAATPRTPGCCTRHGHPRALLRVLAGQVRDLVAGGTVDALVLTGGETAAAVLTDLGADGFDLLDEPEPGVAQGLLTGRHRIPLAIKAGGFGDDATLLRLYQGLGPGRAGR